MKRIIAPLFLCSLIFIACNNNKSKENTTSIDTAGKQPVTITTNEVKEATQDMQQLKEELTKMTPLSADELKTRVPDELMGVTTTNVDVNAAMGASVANADYKINDSAKLKLEIVDCAGPGGAGIFDLQYLGMLNVNTDDENEYVKTIDFNGGKAFENCKKNRNHCIFAYFSGNRFLVSLTGDNVGIDALKDVAKGLEIK